VAVGSTMVGAKKRRDGRLLAAVLGGLLADDSGHKRRRRAVQRNSDDIFYTIRLCCACAFSPFVEPEPRLVVDLAFASPTLSPRK